VGGNDAGPPIDGCSRTNWTFAVNTLCDTPACIYQAARSKDPQNAIDGDLGTRYSSGRAQGSDGPETVTLTFATTVSLDGLHFVTTSDGDGPAGYMVEYATTGTNFVPFVPPVAGPGTDDLLISFPMTAMRAVRVTQTGTKDTPWWSIHELTVRNCRNNNGL
jgi:hypothetical protein